MARIILAMVVFFSLISTAAANLSPTKDELRLARMLLAERMQKPAPPGQVGKFRISEWTEIRLNGRPCRYDEVPAHATVILLEMDPDGKTAVRVHFRTKK